MQTANVNPPIKVTCRHMDVTDAIRDYAEKKVDGLRLDYPRIIEAQVILDVEKYRQQAEIILHCNNHITIEASSETDDLYASIDESVSKIARQMRKYKTRMMRSHRPRRGEVREIEEKVINLEGFDDHEEERAPDITHTERYPVKPMYVDEAVLQLEMTHRPFFLFQNAENEAINIVFRRRNGEVGLIEPILR